MTENKDNIQQPKKVVIELDNVKRDFLVGDETVHALKGVSFKIYEGGLRKIYSTQSVGMSRHAIKWRILPRWRLRENDVTIRTSHTTQPKNWVYLSELQPPAQDYECGECRAALDV